MGQHQGRFYKFCRSGHLRRLKPHPHLYVNAKTHAKRIMWTCRRTAFAFIRLCGVCSANRWTLSVWSWYFKEKDVRHHTDVDVHPFGQPTNNQRNACSFACVANAEQATFCHSFAFASVPHALFAFAYRCGPGIRKFPKITYYKVFLQLFQNFLLSSPTYRVYLINFKPEHIC